MSRSWKHLLGMANETAKARVEDAMNQATDPRIQLNMAVAEMQTQYAKLKDAAAVVIADAERQEQRAGQLQRQIDQWTASAKVAVKAGRTDDARRLAMNIDGAQQQLDEINRSLPQQKEAAEQARHQLEAFTQEMEEKMRKRAQLLNEEDQAKHNEQITEAMKSFSDLSGSTLTPSFDQVEDRIHDRASKARATASLNGTDPHLAELDMHVQEAHDRADAILAGLTEEEPAKAGKK